MKTKLFLSFLIFMMGVGSLYAKTENDPRYRLEKAFEWHLTPGTYEQKEYAMQNPGEWVRIDDQRKSGFQRNEYGIRTYRTITLVRLICYDKEEQRFLYEERVASVEDDNNRGSWEAPLLSLLLAIGSFFWGTCALGAKGYNAWIYFIISCIVSIGPAWIFNLPMMWGEIIAIAFILIIIGLKYLVKSIKKKKEIKN